MGGTPGGLYVVATPIGNLEDMTLRARRVLGEVDWVACEDTRRTGRLLAGLGIDARLVSFWQGNERARTRDLLERLERGESGALVSDAGTPLVSDPGYGLVRDAAAAGVPVIPVPGPSAALALLSVSGLPVTPFTFLGFLPRSHGAVRRKLEVFARLPTTMVLYEAPGRVEGTLRAMLEVLGDRPAVIGRELTKLHEEILRGTLSELLAQVEASPPRGEVTVAVGPGEVEAPDRDRIGQALAELLGQGATVRDAARRVADRYGASRREVYRIALDLERDREE